MTAPTELAATGVGQVRKAVKHDLQPHVEAFRRQSQNRPYAFASGRFHNLDLHLCLFVEELYQRECRYQANVLDLCLELEKPDVLGDSSVSLADLLDALADPKVLHSVEEEIFREGAAAATYVL